MNCKIVTHAESLEQWATTGIRIFTCPKKVCSQESSTPHQKGMRKSRAGRWLKSILPWKMKKTTRTLRENNLLEVHISAPHQGPAVRECPEIPSGYSKHIQGSLCCGSLVLLRSDQISPLPLLATCLSHSARENCPLLISAGDVPKRQQDIGRQCQGANAGVWVWSGQPGAPGQSAQSDRLPEIL